MLGFRDLAFVAQGLGLPVHSTGLLLNCAVPAKVYLNQDVFLIVVHQQLLRQNCACVPKARTPKSSPTKTV